MMTAMKSLIEGSLEAAFRSGVANAGGGPGHGERAKAYAAKVVADMAVDFPVLFPDNLPDEPTRLKLAAMILSGNLASIQDKQAHKNATALALRLADELIEESRRPKS